MEAAQSGRPAARDLLALVRKYEAVCNRYDVEAAVAMFAEDGGIEYAGTLYTGRDALCAAHEYDVGAGNVVKFTDLAVEGDRVRCTFVATDELCRIAGTSGPRSLAELQFAGARIRRFAIGEPDEEERARMSAALRRFRQWAREHYPEEVAKGFEFNYESGAALRRVAEAWRDAVGAGGAAGEGGSVSL